MSYNWEYYIPCDELVIGKMKLRYLHQQCVKFIAIGQVIAQFSCVG